MCVKLAAVIHFFLSETSYHRAEQSLSNHRYAVCVLQKDKIIRKNKWNDDNNRKDSPTATAKWTSVSSVLTPVRTRSFVFSWYVWKELHIISVPSAQCTKRAGETYFWWKRERWSSRNCNWYSLDEVAISDLLLSSSNRPFEKDLQTGGEMAKGDTSLTSEV